MDFLFALPWVAVYDGDGDGAGDGAGTDEAAKKAAEEAAKKKVEGDKVFTQAEVNRMLADDRRKHDKKVQETITQLEELKKAKGVSEQGRQELQNRIDELSNSLLTKEEQAKKEQEKLRNQHKQELENERKERERWHNLFTKESITNKITAAAAAAKAFSAEQVQALLSPHTRIAEVLDDDGKPTGDYVPKVKFSDKDKEGKDVSLDLTIEEAVKRMKELPDRFGNLFESDSPGGLGGLGGNRSGSGGSDPNKPPTDPVKYREWRKKYMKR